MRQPHTSGGFTLMELVVTTFISATVCLGVVQLFHQNERLFRDQSILVEMQQSARAALALITDDVRLAGQGVPVYAGAAFGSKTEATAVILSGSTSNRIHLRAGVTDLDSVAAGPFIVSPGTPLEIKASEAITYSAHLGTLPQGRYLYLWDAHTGWARALIESISGLSRTIAIRPVETSSGTIHFNWHAAISLEEAVAIFHDSQTRSIRRASAKAFDDTGVPQWAPANEIAAHVMELVFRYYDASDGLLPAPDTLLSRQNVARVDVEVSVQAASPLSDGTQPVYSLSQRTVPRNLAVR